MTRKSMWVLLAVLANLALLPLVTDAPEGRAQSSDGGFFFHCCKKSASGRRYCCKRCCVMTWNCKRHKMCRRGKKWPTPKLADWGAWGELQ